MKNKRPSFEAFKKRALQNEEVKKAYDLLEPEFAVLEKVIKTRKNSQNMLTKENSIDKIPEQELWLYDPANKELVERLKKSLKQEATIDWDSIKHKYE